MLIIFSSIISGIILNGSTLAQVMACCLTAPSHYLNQCWIVLIGVFWNSPEGRKCRRHLSFDLDMTFKITYLCIPRANELTEVHYSFAATILKFGMYKQLQYTRASLLPLMTSKPRSSTIFSGSRTVSYEPSHLLCCTNLTMLQSHFPQFTIW